MRVIRVELSASLTSNDNSVSLASDEIRAQLFREVQSIDAELSDIVRQRAAAYFPPNYSVFVRTRLAPERLRTVTELWVVDPTIRWPAGLLTRSAWKLLVPMLSHVVRDSFESRLQGIAIDIDPKDARIMVLSPARGWRDPVLLSGFILVVTSVYWLVVHDWITRLLTGIL